MPFKAKYSITEITLNNISLIASAREVIEQARLLPQWEAKLRREALVRSTHSSTAIEGNNLTLEQVRDLSAGKNVIATVRDKQEVLNYIAALEKIPNFVKKGKIRIADILNIHKILTKNVMTHSVDCGAFRNRQVFVGRRVFKGTSFKEIVEYMPPQTKDVPDLMNDFVDWLNRDATWNMSPVILAALVHYEIARIHPFIDGNGRTARLLATLVLYLSGFDHRRIFALDDFYDRDRKAYYDALKTVQNGNGDLTRWLEYFSTGVAYSVNEVKEAVLKLGPNKKVTGLPTVHLSPRQVKIIELITTQGKVANKDLHGLFAISAQAVHKELAKLKKMQLIKSVGKGRALHYILDDRI